MEGIIDLSQIRATMELRKGISIEPAREYVSFELADDHTCEPIKSLDDIEKISRYFIKNKKYRDNMLFITGINFGLRISDLLVLRFCYLINDNMTFKESFPILEKKTKNTRKVRKNRVITINDAVKNAVILYLENTPGVSLSDYMFRCEGNRGGHKNEPMTRQSVDRILKETAKSLCIETKIATHSLRKTFAYHQMAMSNNDPRKLLLLQRMFGHSTVVQTLTYIGITQEEMSDAYRALNLGINERRREFIDVSITESELTAM